MKKLAPLLLVGLTACDGGPTAPAPSALAAPGLLSPAEGAVVPQNQPFPGCPMTTGWPFGSHIRFEWQAAPAGADVVAYQIVAEHPQGRAPIVGAVTDATSYTYAACGGHVLDGNLTGWEWRVRVQDRTGRFGEWSAPRRFQFSPCRVDDKAC